nr:ribonuclease H-like domain-containing protein [Tanacetum cinerariifolium]
MVMARRLSHLNFGAINHLARHNLVRGLTKLKFEKDHLCSACVMGKSKKKPHKPKSEDTNQEKLYLLHKDLCGPMHVTSVNGKKYILVIVDDYSRFTWVKYLRSKDEAQDFIIKFLTMIQVRLKAPVRQIRIDNETEFVNQTLREYYKKVDISHETFVARTLLQNGVVERRNRTVGITTAGLRLMLLGTVDTAAEVTEEITLSESRFRIDSKSLNKVSVLVVLDLSKVANPLYSLRDKDLLKSKDPQVVSEPFKGTLKKKTLFVHQRSFCDLMESLNPQSLWEVILNGDSPTPTRIVDAAVQVIAPTTTEQSLPSEWKTHTLIWKNKANLKEQSLDDLFNNLKIYEAEVNGSSTSSHTKKIAFVSSNNPDSTNESVNVVPSVSAASSKATSNSLQLDNEDLKQIDADDLEEMDLKWQMAMLTMRARRFLKRTGRNLGANETSAIGFVTPQKMCRNGNMYRGHYFIIQQHRIYENDL